MKRGSANGSADRKRAQPIAVGSAAEAIKIAFIQLHAGGSVVVKGAANHSRAVWIESIQDCSLRHRDRCLYIFIEVHFISSLSVERTKHPPIGRCFVPSTMVMPDFSKNRLIGGQGHFKKQDKDICRFVYKLMV